MKMCFCLLASFCFSHGQASSYSGHAKRAPPSVVCLVAAGQVREVVKKIDDCVGLLGEGEPFGSNLWPSGWWWGFEFGRVEVKLSGKEVVEHGHSDNDLVTIVRHDGDRLGCLSVFGGD
jgi:hypothetical protein